jgi:hypothetical protein
MVAFLTSYLDRNKCFLPPPFHIHTLSFLLNHKLTSPPSGPDTTKTFLGIKCRPVGHKLLRLGGCGIFLLCCFASCLLTLETEEGPNRPHRPLPELFPKVSHPHVEKVADVREEQASSENEERFVCRRPTRRMRRKVRERKQVSKPPPPDELVNEKWVGVGGGRGGWGKWRVVREPGLESVVEEE